MPTSEALLACLYDVKMWTKLVCDLDLAKYPSWSLCIFLWTILPGLNWAVGTFHQPLMWTLFCQLVVYYLTACKYSFLTDNLQKKWPCQSILKIEKSGAYKRPFFWVYSVIHLSPETFLLSPSFCYHYKCHQLKKTGHPTIFFCMRYKLLGLCYFAVLKFGEIKFVLLLFVFQNDNLWKGRQRGGCGRGHVLNCLQWRHSCMASRRTRWGCHCSWCPRRSY